MEPTYTDEQLANIDPPAFEFEGKTYTHYEATQKQREIENSIRKCKRREAGATNAEDKATAKARIQVMKTKYKEFSEAAGLRQQPERMKAYVPQKTVDYAPVRGIIKTDAIELPIEQRNFAKGNPNAMRLFDVGLNRRQTKLLQQLPEVNSQIRVPKKTVSMKDLSALTAETGHEFAMFTKGGERLIIRGDSFRVNVYLEDAMALASAGYRWSGHTHASIEQNSTIASAGDKDILACFVQEFSAIYNAKGQWEIFRKE